MYKCVSCLVEYGQQPCYLAPNGTCEKCTQQEMECWTCDEDERKDCDVNKLVYAPCKYCKVNIKTTCMYCKLHCCTANMWWIHEKGQSNSWRCDYPFSHYIRTKMLCSDCAWVFHDYGIDDVIRNRGCGDALHKFKIAYALETYKMLKAVFKKYNMHDKLFIKSIALSIVKL